jgi:peptidoglycan-associated lipoprotein
VSRRDPRRRASLALPLLIAALALAGCPRRPMLSTAAAPSPSISPTPEAAAPAPAPAPAPAVVESPVAVPALSPLAPPTSAPPRPARAPLAEYAAHAALHSVHFDFDRWDIRPADRKRLEQSAAWLVANERQEVLIEGHCDQRGTAEYNMALGDRRAKAVLVFLAEHGVALGRLSTISFGDERLLCEDPTEACWARNRRAALLTRDKRPRDTTGETTP